MPTPRPAAHRGDRPPARIRRAREQAADAATRRERDIADARAEAERTAPVRLPDDTSPDGRGRRR